MVTGRATALDVQPVSDIIAFASSSDDNRKIPDTFTGAAVGGEVFEIEQGGGGGRGKAIRSGMEWEAGGWRVRGGLATLHEVDVTNSLLPLADGSTEITEITEPVNDGPVTAVLMQDGLDTAVLMQDGLNTAVLMQDGLDTVVLMQD